MLARVPTDADVAIGSRYVAGGAVDETWGFRRRQLSLWGNRLARWIAGLRGVRDCTAGFKAIRTAALREARVAQISVLGYAFQVALLHRLLHSGARVVEEPIYFRDHGVTKLGLDSMLEFMCGRHFGHPLAFGQSVVAGREVQLAVAGIPPTRARTP